VAAKQNFERKHFFIDRKLQGRYMLTFLIPMVIMLVFMIFTLYIATQSLTATTTRIIRENVDNRIATRLQDRTDPPAALYQEILTGIRDYLRGFSTDPHYRKALLDSLLWVFGAGLLVLIIQIALLTIFISHKLAGPIYRFEKVCQSLIQGDYTVQIRLRKGDEMQNLAHLLDNVIQLTRERMLVLRDEADQEKRNEVQKKLQI
jgi:ABC-type sugar transport system permease subunit